jgi:hypothetical protein
LGFAGLTGANEQKSRPVSIISGAFFLGLTAPNPVAEVYWMGTKIEITAKFKH